MNRDATSAPTSPAMERALLNAVFQAGLDAVHGRRAVADYLAHTPIDRPVWIIAIGKAASAMTRGATQALGARLVRGLVISKTGHIETVSRQDSRLICLEAGHPLPDTRSLAAGEALCRFLGELPVDATVLFLISGGTSSLVEVLPEGADLEALQRLNRWLLGSGLAIGEINRIRQSLSTIKGGRLLAQLHGRAAEVLLISDVAGDDPAVIGSGLLYPPAEDTTPLPAMPAGLAALMIPVPAASSAQGRVPHHIVASLDTALARAAGFARARGLPATVMDERLAGDALETGRRLVRQMHRLPAGLYLWGGETTVTLPEQPGRGGRNQQLALAAAVELSAHNTGSVLLAAGTDGTDGPTGAAGAIVDAGSVARIMAAGLDPADCLQRADAAVCLEASGDLLYTGPTGTNVTDMVIGLNPPAPEA